MLTIQTSAFSKSRIARRSIRRGFTLLEMMGVLLIIGLIASLAIVAVVSQGDKARRATTISMLKIVDSALKSYRLDNGSYPSGIVNLVPKYLEKTPTDAWKRPIIYAPNASGSAKPYLLYSTGESGEQGNVDNIDFWTADQPATGT